MKGQPGEDEEQHPDEGRRIWAWWTGMKTLQLMTGMGICAEGGKSRQRRCQITRLLAMVDSVQFNLTLGNWDLVQTEKKEVMVMH